MRYIGIWCACHMKHNTWHADQQHGAAIEKTMCHIDFAAAHNIGDVLVEGWNEDWTTTVLSFTRGLAGPLDFTLLQARITRNTQ